MIPTTPSQRVISPTRIALTEITIIPTASASPASRSRYSLITFAAPFVSACSTAWPVKSWPIAKWCVSSASTA